MAINKRPAGDREIERVRKLTRVLDHYLLDPLIGLLPGVGDVVGSLIGLYTISIAVRRKIHPVVVARMFLNLGLDTIIGFIPLLGDAMDIVFKANNKNLALLTERHAAGGRATRGDWLFVAAAAAIYLAIMALVIWGIIALVRAL